MKFKFFEDYDIKQEIIDLLKITWPAFLLLFALLFANAVIAKDKQLTDFQKGIIEGHLQTRTTAINCALLEKDKQSIIECLMRKKNNIDINVKQKTEVK